MGNLRYGGIADQADLERNLTAHCIPLDVIHGKAMDSHAFLAERRQLMACKIQHWFESL